MKLSETEANEGKYISLFLIRIALMSYWIREKYNAFQIEDFLFPYAWISWPAKALAAEMNHCVYRKQCILDGMGGG